MFVVDYLAKTSWSIRYAGMPERRLGLLHLLLSEPKSAKFPQYVETWIECIIVFWISVSTVSEARHRSNYIILLYKGMLVGEGLEINPSPLS